MALTRESDRKTSSAPIVALCGFMAAGKTTVGRMLAARLHWRFIDLDCEIECRSGQEIREIFTRQGEPRFREIEAEALQWVLGQTDTPTVIALGGGTLVRLENAELLHDRGARVVFLDLPVEELLERCRAAGERCGDNPRPLAGDEKSLRLLYAQRLPQYRKAELVLKTQRKQPQQIAHEIVAALQLNHKNGKL